MERQGPVQRHIPGRLGKDRNSCAGRMMEQDPCQNPEMMEQSVFLPGTENLIQLQTCLGKKHFFVTSAFGEYLPVAALSCICVPQSTYPGGVEPRQVVSPRPEGQGRCRFTTASASCLGKNDGASARSRVARKCRLLRLLDLFPA